MKNNFNKTNDYNFILIFVILTFSGAALLFSNTTRDLGILKKSGAQIFTLCAIISLFYYSLKNKIKISLAIEHKIFGIYIIYLFFNLLTQIFSTDIIIFFSGLEMFYRFFIYFLFSVCVYNAVEKFENLKYLFFSVLVLSIIAVIYGYFQVAGYDFKLVEKYGWGNLKASFGNPQFYGAFILNAVFINAAGIVIIKNLKYRILAGLAIINLLIHLPPTEARSSFLGFFCAVIFIIFMILWKIKKIRFYFAGIVFAVVTIIGILVNIEGSFPNKIYEEIKYRFNVTEYGTGQMRMSSYRAALRCIYDNYFFGYGVGSYVIADRFYRSSLYQYEGITNNELNTHSEELEIWQESGTIGLCLYYVLLLTLYFRAIHFIFKITSYRYALALIFLIAGVISVWIQNFFDVALRFTSGAIFYWLNISLVLIFIERKFAALEKSNTIKFEKFTNQIILAFFGILLIFTIRYHYNNYITNSMLQTATSYERPDSKFYDETGKENPKLRYKYLIEFYNKGLEHNKYDYETYYKLAHCYYSLNDYDKALELYKKLEKFSPFYANLNYNISLCYLNKQDYNNAIYYLKREIWTNYVYINFKRLYLYYNLKNPNTDNISIIRNAIWLEKANPEHRSFLAYEYFQRNRYYNALEQYILCTRLFSDYNVLTSGLISPEKEKKIEELKTLKIEALKNIGVIYYYNLKNNKRAAEYFNEYIHLTNNNEEKNKIISLLNLMK